jgi:ribosome-associated protein
MDIRKLQRAIVDGLEDVKAQHIAVFNTEHLSPLFERVIVATGASNRQTKSLAASVRDTVRSRGLPVMRVEGEENGEWIIVDCGAAVVHIMQPAIREYYHLEEIWGGKAVKMKLGAAEPTRLVKAEEPPAQARAGAKAPARKAPAKKRASARRPAAPREVPAKKAVRKIVAGRPARPAAKTAAPKRRT